MNQRSREHPRNKLAPGGTLIERVIRRRKKRASHIADRYVNQLVYLVALIDFRERGTDRESVGFIGISGTTVCPREISHPALSSRSTYYRRRHDGGGAFIYSNGDLINPGLCGPAFVSRQKEGKEERKNERKEK